MHTRVLKRGRRDEILDLFTAPVFPMPGIFMKLVCYLLILRGVPANLNPEWLVAPRPQEPVILKLNGKRVPQLNRVKEMPRFNRIAPPHSISEFDPVPDSHIFQEQEGRFCPIVNQAVQLFFLLDNPDFSGIQLVQNLVASMNDDFVNHQLLIRWVEGE